MSTKNRTRRTTTRNIQHKQMIEQINIALEQKGSGNFSAGRGKLLLPSETNVRKESIYIVKSDEEWTSRVLPIRRDKCWIQLNYEGIAVIELQFYHFPDSDRLPCWLCHRLNSLNDWQLWWSVNHQGIILHIIIVLHQRCLNCSECFQRPPCSIHANYKHQGNS